MLALFLKPLVFIVIMACILLPVRFAVLRWMKDCKLKRVLLFRLHSRW